MKQVRTILALPFCIVAIILFFVAAGVAEIALAISPVIKDWYNKRGPL